MVLLECLWPRQPSRGPVPTTVPADIAADYVEASLVIGYSTKASAALSRRCLQHLLWDKGSKQRQLGDQLTEMKPTMPSALQDFVDLIQLFGNLSAHPKENKNTGEVIDVEPGEAEVMLDVLDSLFDFYYVKPARYQELLDSVKAKKEASQDAKRQ